MDYVHMLLCGTARIDHNHLCPRTEFVCAGPGTNKFGIGNMVYFGILRREV